MTNDRHWVQVATYGGFRIAIEWVRGRPAPKWADYIPELQAMREMIEAGRGVANQTYSTATVGRERIWFCLFSMNDAGFTVQPHETMN